MTNCATDSVLADKLAARRSVCAPLAGRSTLNRLESSRRQPNRCAKFAADMDPIEALSCLFLDARKKASAEITLDLDATTDDPHGFALAYALLRNAVA